MPDRAPSVRSPLLTGEINRARLAGLVAVAYVLFFFVGIFVHYFTSGDAYTLRYSLMLPGVWMAALAGTVIGWGLWNHYRWAWWAGLIGVLFQLFGSIRHLIDVGNVSPSFGVIVVLALLVIFLSLILSSGTRKLCIR